MQYMLLFKRVKHSKIITIKNGEKHNFFNNALFNDSKLWEKK